MGYNNKGSGRRQSSLATKYSEVMTSKQITMTRAVSRLFLPLPVWVVVV